MRSMIAVSLLIAAVAAVPVFRVGTMTFTSEEDALFETFVRQYERAYYDDHEKVYRKGIFRDNLHFIRSHNEDETNTYTLAMNEFGDMTFDEFHRKYTGFLGERKNYLRSRNTADLSGVVAPDSIDWTQKGAVTGVKNQGQCGSCWSFSTTGSIEGAWFLAGHPLVSLSEQELMDCSKAEGNQSCEGGLMDDAFEFVIKNGGICSESDYPYLEKDQTTCKRCTTVAKITSYTDVDHTADALKAAVAKGPVSVAIEADQQSFQFYSSGVMTGSCGTQLDHGVLAVGYGTLDGTDYWKVKNSWGTTWGMEGYILLERNKAQSGGQCGILLSASYPVV